jgi:AAA family ATP:ADP antiporter
MSSEFRKSLPRLITLCALGFTVLTSYELSRSSVESLFLEAHGSDALPTVWILVAIAATLVVTVYNHFATRVSLPRLFAGAVIVTLTVLALLLGARAMEVPYVHYGLYVWKDVYIVVLVEMFWTFANFIYDAKSARWYYGLFLVMGTLGAITGGLGVGLVAETWGTAGALWLVFPVLGATLLAMGVFRDVDAVARVEKNEKTNIGDGVRILRQSPYLGWMLALIVAVQIAITLVDFEYNAALEAAYPDVDARTAVGGQVYSAINVVSLALQAGAGVVLSGLGVGRTLLAIPLFLATALSAFMVAPRFLTMAITKVASKCFDYSLFRSAKEILYIPLSYDEKTRGKAIIDMMTYRVAKGAASLLLLGLAAVSASSFSGYLTLSVIAVWLAVTVVIVRRWRAAGGEASLASQADGDE